MNTTFNLDELYASIHVSQSYTDPNHCDQRDVEIFNAVSEQVALAIERKKSYEQLKHAKTLAEAANQELVNVNQQLEQTITRANEMAAHAKNATRSKSAFWANMGHEIRTPMNAILGLTSLLLETDLTEKQSDYLNKVYRSSHTLLDLISDILDFSKIEAGKLHLEYTEFQVQDVIDILIDMFSGKVSEKGLELGAVDYITKPFSLPIVKIRVKTHLELKRHRDMLEAFSTVDGLTGIPNRRRFDEVLTEEWKRAERDVIFLSLIMIDIGFFKNYNDCYGHQLGDDSLKQVAQTLVNSVHRPADCVTRYGGEEFTCILPGTDIKGAIRVAEGMCHDIETLNIPHDRSLIAQHVTISLGAASILPATLNSPEILIKEADKALYLAKESGRNCVKNFDISFGLEVDSL